MGLSVDRTASLKAWAGSLGGITYPLLADFWPHGKVAEAYGVFNADSGSSRRAVVIIDKEGAVRFKELYQGSIPDPKDIAAELDKLR